MKRSTQIILHTGILLTLVMLEAFFFYIGCSIKGSTSIQMQILPWTLLTCLFYLCNEWLSGHRLPVNLLLAINALFCAFMLYTGLSFFIGAEPATMTTLMFRIFFLTCPVLVGFYLTWFPEDLRSLVLSMDLLIFFFLLYEFLKLADVMLADDPLETAFLVILALVLCSIICVRTSADAGNSIPLQGFLPVILFISLGLLLALAFSLLVSGQVQSITDLFVLLLQKIVGGILRILFFFGNLINRFLEWLASLLPNEEASEMILEPMLSVGDMEMQEETSAMIPPAYLIGTAILLLTILICFIARRLHGVKIQRRKIQKSAGQIRRSGQILTTLHHLFDCLIQLLHYQFCLSRKRKTPSALAIRAERCGRKNGCIRMPGESLPFYLRRLSACPELSDRVGFQDAMQELSRLIELEYYAGCPAILEEDTYHRIRKFL